MIMPQVSSAAASVLPPGELCECEENGRLDWERVCLKKSNYSLHDDHAFAGGCIYIDIVHTDTGSSDELQIRSVDHVGGHLGAGPHEQRIIILEEEKRRNYVGIGSIPG